MTLYHLSGYFPLILTLATANVSSPGVVVFADPCVSQGKEASCSLGGVTTLLSVIICILLLDSR